MRILDVLHKNGNVKLKKGFEKYIEYDNSTVYDLELGDVCYVLQPDGSHEEVRWSGSMIQCRMRDLGFIFLSVGGIEEYLKQREVYNKIRKYSCDFSEGRFVPYWEITSADIRVREESTKVHSTLYFKSNSDIQKAIDEVGKENFKNYYLLHNTLNIK